MTNVEGLTEILHEETDAYAKLLGLAETKRQVIIDHDLTSLERISSDEQTLSDQLKVYEKRRVNILRTFTDSEDIPTVTDVIGALAEGSPERKSLQEAKDELLRIAGQMQFLNGQNQVLLQQAMEMVEFDLTLFKSLRQAPETGNYGRDAYSTGTLLPSGGFDAKQ